MKTDPSFDPDTLVARLRRYREHGVGGLAAQAMGDAARYIELFDHRAAEEKASTVLLAVVGTDQRLLDLAADEIKRRAELFSRCLRESPNTWPTQPTPKLAAITSVTDDIVRGFLL